MTEAGKSESAPIVASAGAIARPWFLLGGALAIGFVGEALLHGQPPGAGYAVAALVATVIWLALGTALGVHPSRTGWTLLALIVFFSAMVAVRASPALQALDVMAGFGLALLMATVYAGGGLARMSVTDYVVALFLSGLALIIQPFFLIFGDLPKATRPENGDRRFAPVLVGVGLAVPLLLVFGALFAGADAVFARLMHDLFSWVLEVPQLIARLVFSLILSWLALGLARQAFTTSARPGSPRTWERLVNVDFLHLGGATAVTLLALVNGLFVAFVAVQAVYLFGGADTLARTGLSYSEYARRGFFELVTVAALVLALVLLVDWLTLSVSGRARRAIHLLHGLLIALTLVILASALFRMRLYQDEYGLTALRFYTTAFMIWLAAVLLWLVATVLRDNAPASQGRRRFAFGALVAGLALLVVLNLANPDAWIAGVNLRRAVAGTGQPLDARYLTEMLSADAVPANLTGLGLLTDPAARAGLACGLQAEARRLDQQSSRLTWRGFNVSTGVARRALAVAQPDLSVTPCVSGP
jgi:hypothetical protein